MPGEVSGRLTGPLETAPFAQATHNETTDRGRKSNGIRFEAFNSEACGSRLTRCHMVNAGKVRPAVVALILSSIAVHVEPAVGQTRKPTSPPTQRNSSPKSLVTWPAPRQLEPRALEVLKSVHDRLALARTLSFVAVDTLESRTDEDTPRIQRN